MKKIIGVFLFVIFAFSVYGACYDDDGGVNYKQKGFCKDLNGTEGTDFCRNTTLVEYYCYKDGCKAQAKICSGCEDGVCIGAEAEDTFDANKPPKVDLFILTTPGKTSVAFKADVSDPEGEMVVYTIELGDGNKVSNKKEFIHDYEAAGTFKVKITARDLAGASTEFSKEVIIEEAKRIEAPEETAEEVEKKLDNGELMEKGFFRKVVDWFKGLFS